MSDEQQSSRKPPKRVQLDRYVVSVDGQAKIGYGTRVAAEVEASRIKQKFPRVTVDVTDQEDNDVIRGEAESNSLE